MAYLLHEFERHPRAGEISRGTSRIQLRVGDRTVGHTLSRLMVVSDDRVHAALVQLGHLRGARYSAVDRHYKRW